MATVTIRIVADTSGAETTFKATEANLSRLDVAAEAAQVAIMQMGEGGAMSLADLRAASAAFNEVLEHTANPADIARFAALASEADDARDALLAAAGAADKTGKASGQLARIQQRGSHVAQSLGYALNDAQQFAFGFDQGVRAISNNLPNIIENFQRLTAETGSTKAALGGVLSSFMGPAGILNLLALGVVAWSAFGDKAASESEEAKQAIKDLREEIGKAVLDLGALNPSALMEQYTERAKQVEQAELALSENRAKAAEVLQEYNRKLNEEGKRDYDLAKQRQVLLRQQPALIETITVARASLAKVVAASVDDLVTQRGILQAEIRALRTNAGNQDLILEKKRALAEINEQLLDFELEKEDSQRRSLSLAEKELLQLQARVALLDLRGVEGPERLLAGLDLATAEALEAVRDKFAEDYPAKAAEMAAVIRQNGDELREALQAALSPKGVQASALNQAGFDVDAKREIRAAQEAVEAYQMVLRGVEMDAGTVGAALDTGLIRSLSDVGEALRVLQAEYGAAETDEARAEIGALIGALEALGVTFERAGDDAEDWASRVERAAQYASEALGALSATEAAWTDAQVQRAENRADSEIGAIERRLDSETISEAERERLEQQRTQAQAKADKERAKIERAAAARNKVISMAEAAINTAVAVTAALRAGPVAGPILAGVIGALGAAQIGIIAATPLPGGGGGGGRSAGRSSSSAGSGSSASADVSVNAAGRAAPAGLAQAAPLSGGGAQVAADRTAAEIRAMHNTLASLQLTSEVRGEDTLFAVTAANDRLARTGNNPL